MNNSLDSNSPNSGNSQFDDWMQSLSIDLHQLNSTENFHNNPHDSSLPHNSYPDTLHHTVTPDFTHTSWTDNSQGFSEHQPQTDWTHANHETVSQWHDTESSFASATYHHYDSIEKPQVLNYSYSSAEDGPYIHIDRSGDVHLHKLDGTTQVVGHVYGRYFYNSANEHIGYLGKDGHVYRWRDDSSVGRVEGGHIYRENGQETGRADTDLEGAAHMLFVVRGGTP
jgi:hypothetical protein